MKIDKVKFKIYFQHVLITVCSSSKSLLYVIAPTTDQPASSIGLSFVFNSKLINAFFFFRKGALTFVLHTIFKRECRGRSWLAALLLKDVCTLDRGLSTQHVCVCQVARSLDDQRPLSLA